MDSSILEYKTPSGKNVLVIMVTSEKNTPASFPDLVFLGEVTEFVRHIPYRWYDSDLGKPEPYRWYGSGFPNQKWFD